MRSFARSHPLFVVLMSALVLRLLAAAALQYDLDVHKHRPFLIMGDAEGYWELGSRIAHGQPYQIYDPPRRVLRMPGYPIFVAGCIRLSELLGIAAWDHFAARLLLAVVGTLACGMVAMLGTDLFGKRAGLWGAAMTAVAPPLVGFSVLLLSETLFAFAMMFSLWTLCRLVRSAGISERPNRVWSWAVAAGGALGGAVYVRPTWLLIGPLFAVLFIFWNWKRNAVQSVVAAGIVVGVSYLALVPWAWRNHTVTGHWVFTTLWVGPSLYDGFNPKATGASDMAFFEKDRPLDRMSEYEADQDYRAKTWEFIRNHPRRSLELTFEKLVRFWMPWPTTPEAGGVLIRAATACYFVPAVVLAVAGWWIGPRGCWRWTLTLGPIVYLSAVHAVFVGSLRYRLPAEYPMCIASAAGLQSLLSARFASLRGD